MFRTQIQLPERLHSEIKKRAQKLGISIAEFIRRGLWSFLSREEAQQKEAIRRALSIAGKFASGKSDVSERHDDYLSEAVGRKKAHANGETPD